MHDISIADNFVCILRSQDLKSPSNFPIILRIMLQIVFTCNKNLCAMLFSVHGSLVSRCARAVQIESRWEALGSDIDKLDGIPQIFFGLPRPFSREICAISSIVGKYRDLEISTPRNGHPELCRFYYGKNRPLQKTQ
jgi:hypothetical protein